jgi:hypothetical protein
MVKLKKKLIRKIFLKYMLKDSIIFIQADFKEEKMWLSNAKITVNPELKTTSK